MGIKKEVVKTEKAPKALGPYSAGIKAGNLVFTAGQLGIDPTSGEFIPGGIEAQTQKALENLSAVLEAAGSSLDQVVNLNDTGMDELSENAGFTEETFR